MSQATAHYLLETKRMLQARLAGDEASEDAILEELDDLWWGLSDAERQMLNGAVRRMSTLSDEELVRVLTETESCDRGMNSLDYALYLYAKMWRLQERAQYYEDQAKEVWKLAESAEFGLSKEDQDKVNTILMDARKSTDATTAFIIQMLAREYERAFDLQSPNPEKTIADRFDELAALYTKGSIPIDDLIKLGLTQEDVDEIKNTPA